MTSSERGAFIGPGRYHLCPTESLPFLVGHQDKPIEARRKPRVNQGEPGRATKPKKKGLLVPCQTGGATVKLRSTEKEKEKKEKRGVPDWGFGGKALP